MPKANESSHGFPTSTYQSATAGTTQTQAGATPITASDVVVTVGTANDGVALPRADHPTHIGTSVIVQNTHATAAMNIYPFAGSGGTIDGGAANAAKSLPALTTHKFICAGKDTWRSIKLS